MTGWYSADINGSASLPLLQFGLKGSHALLLGCQLCTLTMQVRDHASNKSGLPQVLARDKVTALEPRFAAALSWLEAEFACRVLRADPGLYTTKAAAGIVKVSAPKAIFSSRLAKQSTAASTAFTTTSTTVSSNDSSTNLLSCPAARA
eukprot:3498894-Pleurochrysis_carterae.AAC.1